MKFPKHLNESGFGWHVMLPIVAVLAVAGIGAYIMSQSHAATCLDYTYSQANSSNTNTGGASATVCTNYVQKVLNGEYQADPNFAWWGTERHGFSGYLSDTGTFDANTAGAVGTFQDYFANLTGNSIVGSQTWAALCGIGLSMPNPDPAHYWEQQAKGAAQHAGCTNQAKPSFSGGGGSVRSVFQAGEGTKITATPGVPAQPFAVSLALPAGATPTVSWYVQKVVPGTVPPTTLPAGVAPYCTATSPVSTSTATGGKPASSLYACTWQQGTLAPGQAATTGQFRWYAKITGGTPGSQGYQWAANSATQPYLDVIIGQ